MSLGRTAARGASFAFMSCAAWRCSRFHRHTSALSPLPRPRLACTLPAELLPRFSVSFPSAFRRPADWVPPTGGPAGCRRHRSGTMRAARRLPPAPAAARPRKMSPLLCARRRSATLPRRQRRPRAPRTDAERAAEAAAACVCAERRGRGGGLVSWGCAAARQQSAALCGRGSVGRPQHARAFSLIPSPFRSHTFVAGAARAKGRVAVSEALRTGG